MDRKGGWTPFPNFLLDQAMPKLSDSAWRVLCLVVRETFGWKDGTDGRRKQARISQARFIRRTGRRNAAISRAIDQLVRSGLVRVTSSDGKPLKTARERRHARLWFSVAASSSCLHLRDINVHQRSLKSEHNRNKRTLKRKQQQTKPLETQ